MQTKIQINQTDITIRPSSLDSFYGCAYQWARVFLGGERSIPNSRATIGTGVHAGIEHMWQDAMKVNSKDVISLTASIDAAVESFESEVANYGVQYGDGEDLNSCIEEVGIGVETFLDDVVPFTEIPKEVETRLSQNIEHTLVKRVSGTVDYITDDTIADVKTSKRSIVPQSYQLQQSIYKHLAEHNGHKVEHNLIQGVVFTKKPYGQVKELEPNVPKAKTAVNNLLDTLDILVTDQIKPELLFRGNPKYYLCSPKYCAFYGDCLFVNGENPEKKTAQIVKL